MDNRVEKNVNLKVILDENHVPESIQWSADDAQDESAATKAFMLAIWDEATKSSLRMDLWTKDMLVDEMHRFFHQSFLAMADSFQRATNDEQGAQMIRDFSADFKEKLNL